MIEPAVVAAAAVVAASILAVSAHDGRVVALGLLVAMVAAPLVASPLPESLSVAPRIIGAVLAAYLLWVSAPVSPTGSAGSGIGWAAETAVAAAAFAIGLSVSIVDPLPGPTVAQGAGLALIVLAIAPVIGRDVLRLGAGVTILVLGSSLLAAAWLGPTAPLAHLAIASLLVGIAGAASVAIGRQPALEVAAGDSEPVGAAAVRSADTTGELSTAGGLAAGGGSVAAGTVRARAPRARERPMSPGEQTSVWAQTEQSEVTAVPAEAPPPVATSPAPATRLGRPAHRSKP